MKTTESQPHKLTRAVRLPRVGDITGDSRSTTWRRVRDDPSFPRPFKLSAGTTVWDEGEILDWIESKKAQQRAGAL
jgi:predicted DNA-binding transcriptional regulator AlpA